jgi:hypothetical protein
MKKIIYLAILSLILGGCEKNQVPVFDTDYRAMNIWFGSNNVVLDNAIYNYSYSLEEDSLLFLAQITGLPSDSDRSFSLEAYSGDVAEAEGSFRTITYEIKAGEFGGEFPIFFNSSNLKNGESFSEKDGQLVFRMVPNDEFAEGVVLRQQLTVILKNYLAKPKEWDTATYPNMPYKNYFGNYSKVKYSFMIQVTGLVDFQIVYNATIPYDKETNKISVSYVAFLLSKVKLALEEYNETHQKPLTDENGSVVVF